jgi:hypothetical protein
MTTGYLAAQTPQINIPFLNIDGTVSQVWLLFLIQLFQRTGGNTSPTYTLAEIEKIAILGLSVVKANGFNGIVTTGQNSTLTIETTVTGIVKGDGTALSAATAGIDYGTVSSVGVTVPSSLLSVTPSTITSSGTFAISLTTQASNTLLAGPITGVGTTPTFRGLVSTDIPALNYVSTLTTQGANQIFAGPSSGVGATPTFRALTTADIAGLGVGTVTSVGMTVPSILSVTPSTITTSGSFALSLTTESANQIFAGPSSGAAATPTFRSLVAADIPALSYAPTTGSTSITTLGTISTGTWNSSTIGVSYGGTGLTSTPSNGQIDIGNGSGFTRTTLTAGSGISVTNASGGITIANTQNTGPAFSAYQSSAQSITASTWTKVQLQSKEFDTASFFDNATNYRFTPTVAGYYQVNGAVEWAFVTGMGGISIYKNGSIFKVGAFSLATSVGTSAIVSSLIYLNGSTDYIELYCYETNGTVNTVTGAVQTYFQAAMVRTS